MGSPFTLKDVADIYNVRIHEKHSLSKTMENS